jgi:hypothetical protein
MKYPADTMRSDMYNYAWASRRFWNNFEKPAIFGEAGANLTYFPPGDRRYHTSYHNQIWACLSNGLAATPVWWDYPVLTAEDWDQLKILAGFVSDIDLANNPYKPLIVSAEGVDLFVMGTGNDAFGWGRSYEQDDISGATLRIRGLADHSYTVTWHDTWSGEMIGSPRVRSRNESLELQVPEMQQPHADVAFKIRMPSQD